jgi:small conductance mechanosensitive channel
MRTGHPFRKKRKDMRGQASWRVVVLVTISGWMLASSDAVAQSETAQDVAADNAVDASYTAVTTIDPLIPIENLRILVKPLTQEELEVETESWFQLLRQKAKQIAAVQLGVKKTNEALQAEDQSDAQAAIAAAETIEDSVEAESAGGNAADKQAQAADTLEAAIKEVASLPTKSADESQQPDPQPEPAAAGDDGNPQASSDQNPPSSDQNTDAVTAAVTEAATLKKDKLLEDISKLQDQRTALADRMEVVLDSLERKGGDVEQYRKYVLAVSGIQIDTNDVSATWATISGWITSKEGGKRWAWNLFRFVLILLITLILAKFVARLTNWLLERRVRLSKLAENLISRMIKNVILAIGLAVALTALEIDITPILAAIGAAGFIIGFALQGTLSNFASGLMILINRPFDIGNVVTAGGVTGKIHQMNLVSTTFRTFDNQTIHVPNNTIWGDVITNITANDTRRVDLEFGIGYDDDFEQAERIIREAVESHPLVLAEPAPEVVMHALADSSVNIVCRPWAKTSDWWTVKTEITREIKRRFDQAGISIPFPQRDVHVYTQAAGKGESFTPSAD